MEKNENPKILLNFSGITVFQAYESTSFEYKLATKDCLCIIKLILVVDIYRMSLRRRVGQVL